MEDITRQTKVKKKICPEKCETSMKKLFFCKLTRKRLHRRCFFRSLAKASETVVT